jgi:hypothetical protein
MVTPVTAASDVKLIGTNGDNITVIVTIQYININSTHLLQTVHLPFGLSRISDFWLVLSA